MKSLSHNALRLRISCLATSALFREACQGSRKHRCGGCGRGGRGYEEQVVGHRSTIISGAEKVEIKAQCNETGTSKSAMRASYDAATLP